MASVEEILTAGWRVFPAWLLIGAGAWLCARALRRWRAVPKGLRDPHRALAVTRSVRTLILGTCVVGVGIGWLASLSWVVLLAVLILGEEMLETSTMINALREGAARAGPSEV